MKTADQREVEFRAVKKKAAELLAQFEKLALTEKRTESDENQSEEEFEEQEEDQETKAQKDAKFDEYNVEPSLEDLMATQFPPLPSREEVMLVEPSNKKGQKPPSGRKP